MNTETTTARRKLSPELRRVLRLMVNAGWEIQAWRAWPHPWRYELRAPERYGGAPVTIDTERIERMVRAGLLERAPASTVSQPYTGGTDSYTLRVTARGRRALRTGYLVAAELQQGVLL